MYADGDCRHEYLYLDSDGRETGYDVYYLDENGELYHDWSCRYQRDDHGNVISEEYTSPVEPDYFVKYLFNYTYQTFGEYTQYTCIEQTKGSGTPMSKTVYGYDEVGNNIKAEYYSYEDNAYVLTGIDKMEIIKDMDIHYVYGAIAIPFQPNAYLVTYNYDAADNLVSTRKEYYSVHHTETATRASMNFPSHCTSKRIEPLKRPGTESATCNVR